jgi:hypothetical protein
VVSDLAWLVREFVRTAAPAGLELRAGRDVAGQGEGQPLRHQPSDAHDDHGPERRLGEAEHQDCRQWLSEGLHPGGGSGIVHDQHLRPAAEDWGRSRPASLPDTGGARVWG